MLLQILHHLLCLPDAFVLCAEIVSELCFGLGLVAQHPKGPNAVTVRVVTATESILEVKLCTQQLSNITVPQIENGSHHVVCHKAYSALCSQAYLSAA